MEEEIKAKQLLHHEGPIDEKFCYDLNITIARNSSTIATEALIDLVQRLEYKWPHCFIVKSGVSSPHYFPWSSLFEEIDNSDGVCIVGEIVIPQIYQGTIELLHKRNTCLDWQILVFGTGALMRYALWINELDRRGFQNPSDHVVLLGTLANILHSYDYHRWAHQRFIYERRSHWMKSHAAIEQKPMMRL